MRIKVDLRYIDVSRSDLDRWLATPDWATTREDIATFHAFARQNPEKIKAHRSLQRWARTAAALMGQADQAYVDSYLRVLAQNDPRIANLVPTLGDEARRGLYLALTRLSTPSQNQLLALKKFEDSMDLPEILELIAELEQAGVTGWERAFPPANGKGKDHRLLSENEFRRLSAEAELLEALWLARHSSAVNVEYAIIVPVDYAQLPEQARRMIDFHQERSGVDLDEDRQKTTFKIVLTFADGSRQAVDHLFFQDTIGLGSSTTLAQRAHRWARLALASRQNGMTGLQIVLDAPSARASALNHLAQLMDRMEFPYMIRLIDGENQLLYLPQRFANMGFDISGQARPLGPLMTAFADTNARRQQSQLAGAIPIGTALQRFDVKDYDRRSGNAKPNEIIAATRAPEYYDDEEKLALEYGLERTPDSFSGDLTQTVGELQQGAANAGFAGPLPDLDVSSPSKSPDIFRRLKTGEKTTPQPAAPPDPRRDQWVTRGADGAMFRKMSQNLSSQQIDDLFELLDVLEKRGLTGLEKLLQMPRYLDKHTLYHDARIKSVLAILHELEAFTRDPDFVSAVVNPQLTLDWHEATRAEADAELVNLLAVLPESVRASFAAESDKPISADAIVHLKDGKKILLSTFFDGNTDNPLDLVMHQLHAHRVSRVVLQNGLYAASLGFYGRTDPTRLHTPLRESFATTTIPYALRSVGPSGELFQEESGIRLPPLQPTALQAWPMQPTVPDESTATPSEMMGYTYPDETFAPQLDVGILSGPLLSGNSMFTSGFWHS